MQRFADAARVAGVVANPLSRGLVRPIGDEARRELFGDAFVPSPKLEWTHGITIGARPAEIWPWLVQMGCERGGWYSYDGLDNGGVASADRIVRDLQHVRVGHVFPWRPRSDDGFVVRAVEPERVLVLGVPGSSATWALVLEPIDDTTTRLITRVRATYDRLLLGLALKAFWHPIHYAMQRRQLLNVKRRAEALSTSRTPYGADAHPDSPASAPVGQEGLPSRRGAVQPSPPARAVGSRSRSGT